MDVFAQVEARGISIGEARGRAEGIIITARDFGATDSNIASRLVSKLNISVPDAQQMLRNYP